MIKLGIVGAGNIVPFHLTAARQAGFEPVAICGTQNSERAKQLASQNPLLDFKNSLDDLLAVDLQAILIAATTESNFAILKKCLEKKIPILVEKPVSLLVSEIEDLENWDTSKVIVGYNRRHYSSVTAFKEKLSNLDFGLVKINIPELSWDPDADFDSRQRMLFENATHILDLIPYLFGKIKILGTEKISDNQGTKFCVVSFRSENRFVGSISLGYGIPENLSIKCWASGLNLELNPIEKLNICKELEMIDASANWPVKRYTKKLLNEWVISAEDISAKPGFVLQFQELRTLITNPEANLRSARLNDAKNALLLATLLS